MPNETWLRALELAEGQDTTARALLRIADATDPEAARWAFQQHRLRKKAGKISGANRMFFTAEALEQATHGTIAEFHASCFPTGALVGDLTAGIGGDAIELVRRGPVEGFETDPERFEYLRHNLAPYGSAVTLHNADSMTAEWNFDYAFADPSRRVEGRRTLDPSEFSPDPRELASRMENLELGLIKLSPMLPDKLLSSLGPGLEFVSFGWECREALVSCGRQAVAGTFAVYTGGYPPRVLRLASCAPPAQTNEPQEFFYEADPAAIRAHALGSFGIPGLGDSNGYLTSSVRIESPFLRSWRVLYHGPANTKGTNDALRKLKAATPILKLRGVKLDYNTERQKFVGRGRTLVVLAIWPVRKSLRHTILAGEEDY